MNNVTVRESQITRLKDASLDVLIIGGGINGAGVLRDLALRAEQTNALLRLGLVEQHHFASGTSGKNSQLLHGGLRYLKYFDFGLVKQALRERAVLLRMAPHLVRPLPFLLPYYGRAAGLVYNFGLVLYDAFAGRDNIGHHQRLSKAAVSQLEPELRRAGLTGGAIYYDCLVHSARMVLENVLDAVSRGAAALNYATAERIEREGPLWRVDVRDGIGGDTFAVTARKIVDATGAWSGVSPAATVREGNGTVHLRLVRGSHLIVPRLNHRENAVAYFETSGRIVFFIPWGEEGDRTLIGTTEAEHVAGPDDVAASREEIEYLLGITNNLFGRRPEIISTYSSLRPLLPEATKSASAVSRGHRIWEDDAGIVHIAGGKFTTFRLMSEEAADLVCGATWPELAQIHATATTPLRPPEAALEDGFIEHLSDYLQVSTYHGYTGRWTLETLEQEAARLGGRLGWTPERMAAEAASMAAQRACK